MTLIELVRALEEAAAAQPAVKMIVPDSVRRLNDMPDAEYGAFAWTQGTHRRRVSSGLTTYHFSLFYIDRLTAGRGNLTEIQSVGMRVLDNVLLRVEAQFPACVEVEDYTYTTFSQRFADECAGVWVDVDIVAATESLCEEEYSS